MATYEEVRAEAPAAPVRHGFRRDVGVLGLMFVSLGSIIGSGWLFGALYAAQEAGPAALVSWGLGAGFMLVLALVHAELGGAYSVAGGTARFPHYSHGSLVGFTMGWVWWLGAATVAPIEVEAALQYFTHYLPWLTATSGGETVLTVQGYAIAVVLMAVFTVVNILGVARLAKSNNLIMVWKIAIPVLALVTLMAVHFHAGNFTAHGGFFPYGFHGIFSAVATGGVIFAYQGFEQAIQLGSESRNPGRNIPLAVVGAMLVGIVIYVLLQVAFIAALDPHNLSHGWSKLAFEGLAGPFAGLASAVGLGWLAILLYVDAAVSPGGTGLLYVATGSRVWYALGHNGYIPSAFSRISRRGIPLWSVLVSFLVGIVVFLPFPGWQKLVGFIVAASSLSYGVAPLALSALRRQDPQRERPFRLPLEPVLSPLGFFVANLVIYWSGWTTNWKVVASIAIGFAVFGAYRASGDRSRMPQLDVRGFLWMPPYLAGLLAISYLGQYDGTGAIPFWWDLGVVAVFSVAIWLLALALRLDPEEARTYVEQLDPMMEEPELDASRAADEPVSRDAAGIEASAHVPDQERPPRR
jgi:amino acid transporter